MSGEPIASTLPAVPEIDTTSTRWQVRAHSISQCVEQLSEVWSTAAQTAEQA